MREAELKQTPWPRGLKKTCGKKIKQKPGVLSVDCNYRPGLLRGLHKMNESSKAQCAWRTLYERGQKKIELADRNAMGGNTE